MEQQEQHECAPASPWHRDPERRPLLLPNQPAPVPPPASELVSASASPDKVRRQKILLLICTSIVAADFAILLSYAPQLAILESLICDDLRDLGDAAAATVTATATATEESFCKSPLVQGDLVLLTGWKDTFDTIPGIVLALPYGYAADRVGRKPVLLLSLAGLLCEELSVRLVYWWHTVVPLRAIWFTPLFQAVGGGPQIATSMAYAMVTDLFPAAERASIFFLIGAAIIIGEVLAGPLSALMMLWTPWFPILAGFGLQLMAFLAAAAISETMPSSGDHAVESSAIDADGSTPPAETSQQLKWTHSQWWKQRWISLQRSGLISTSVLCILGSFLMASVGRQALQLIVQYASKRFSWSIAGASLVITFKALVNLVALVFLLPRLSSVLSKRMSAAGKDRVMVQGSSWLLTAGALIMAISAYSALFIIGVGVLALGWGYYSAVRSLAATLVPASEIGMISTLLGLAESTGTMIAGPALALTFKRGMELGGFWLGLPYLVAAGLFLGAALFNFGVNISNQAKTGDDDAEGEPSDFRD